MKLFSRHLFLDIRDVRCTCWIHRDPYTSKHLSNALNRGKFGDGCSNIPMQVDNFYILKCPCIISHPNGKTAQLYETVSSTWTWPLCIRIRSHLRQGCALEGPPDDSTTNIIFFNIYKIILTSFSYKLNKIIIYSK